MKIRGANGRSNAVDVASNVPTAGKAGQPSMPPVESAATDRVQLSNLAHMAGDDGSSADVAKLSSLSATVSAGRYQVAAGVLSNSIIEASMQLGGGNYV
jgi:hypothetical protein